jgi:hypothetical protein
MRISKELMVIGFLTLVTLIPITLKAQTVPSKEPIFFNLKFHYGFIMKHSDKMGQLANQHIPGIEADVFRMTVGKKRWQAVHNYPIIGYSFHYFHLDPKKPVGDFYSALIYYSHYIVKRSNFFISYRLGTGVGITTKTFDLQTNRQNNLNGSAFNYCLNGRISMHCRLYKNLFLTSGIGIIHFSNGSIKLPNQGINIPTFHIGFAYTPSPDYSSKLPKETSKNYLKKLSYNISANGGLKQEYPVGSREWFASTVSLYIGKQVSRRSILNGGIDLFYDGSKKLVLDTMANPKKGQLYKMGIMAGHEYLVGRVSLLTQFGYYLIDPLKAQKPVYQRVGLKYYINDRWFANLCLKTHFGSADYVEWGIGIKL